ncbi:Hypothetical_protein [Hexamita inflata]|uniref:Hypothetical_protein n=1 Tax=Hexamita inflata TaxID=28002 RepID=A0AA86PMM4_9EUKA|nr:Hypothetical protein HINF_LOCUS29942 [Hexamita inflata]CAI9942301.1 Hypothetical protein HINF_LOCUS29946 [Hexamita inflata]
MSAIYSFCMLESKGLLVQLQTEQQQQESSEQCKQTINIIDNNYYFEQNNFAKVEYIVQDKNWNSPMIKLGKHQRTQQQAYRTGDISSTTSSHGGRTIFREQRKGYLLEMSQVKNYFWHAQTQYYSNSTKKDTEPQCTLMI